MAKSDTSTNNWTREILAFSVLILCALGIVAFSIAAIAYTDTDATREETTRLVFVSVLPLFGTWVGTVLAYYFAGKNLEAATRSTESLSQVTGRLAGVTTVETPVREKMIARTNMKVYTLTQAEDRDIETLKLRKLWDELEAIAPLSRLPILGPDETARALVHRSLLEGFAARQQDAAPAAFNGKTIADLSVDERRLFTLFATVAVSATVGDARTAMKAAGTDCNDVFVTETGGGKDRVNGWLTNTELAGLTD